MPLDIDMDYNRYTGASRWRDVATRRGGGFRRVEGTFEIRGTVSSEAHRKNLEADVTALFWLNLQNCTNLRRNLQ